MKKSTKYNLLVAPYTIWMIGFIIIPLFFILYYGMTTKSGAFTFENLMSIFNIIHLKSFAVSFRLSFVSTLICLVLAFPLALIFREKFRRKKSFIVYIFILPMWMNALLRTFAWLTLLERQGIFNLILSFLHLPNLYIINTEKAIILGMVYNFLPFMILPLYNVLTKIDDDLLNASYDLGANKVMTFLRVILPLSIPGIVSGITMVFVPALTTIIISDILGGGEVLLIGNVIEQEFLQASNWNVGSGLSITLIIFIFIIMAITYRYQGDDESVLM